jgi:GT2 family glycosyltransferase
MTMSAGSIEHAGTPARRKGVVSVIVLNYRGAEDSTTCLRSLQELDWPAERLEVICVDNASGDGSAAAIRAAEIPGVLLIESPTNTGFAGGCNFGAAHASGEYLALINSDARPDPQWLAAAVAQLEYDRGIACVASKVLDWTGDTIDYVGGGLTFYGMGYKREAGQPASDAFDTGRDVLFPTGSAMVVRAETFADVGGFDERFFMFYEDVDLGWRLNLLGHRVRYVPESIVYHKHHASISKFGSFRERYLLERNALLAIFKNYEQPTLDAVLAPSLMLAVMRSLALGGGDSTALDLQRSPGDESSSIAVDKTELTGSYAIAYLAEHFAELSEERAALQRRRVRSDAALSRLFEEPMEPAYPDAAYLKAFWAIADRFKIADALGHRRRVLVITADTLADQMAGPAIRAFHIADVLSADHDVRLVSTTHCSLREQRFDAAHVRIDALFGVVDWAEIIIFQGFILHQAPWLADAGKILVVDVYDPMHLEQLEQAGDQHPDARRRDVLSTTSVLNEQLSRGDFFLCASESQRKFWLGQLAAVGRVNPDNYARDHSLRSLIAVCPFGLAAEPPQRTRPAIKGVVPGIEPDDKVILWAGGVYNWFDPLTLIHAVDDVSRRHPDVRLYFLGMKHPNPTIPEMRMAFQARELADSLSLTGKYVFFNEGWVDYDDRQNYLLDADLGVSTHFEHVETTFSFRTRILDYLWAGLPIVATGGDTFGDLIEAEQLGVVVPEHDVAALSAALERALFDADFIADCRANVVEVRQRFVWERALAPLIDFCRDARPAADHGTALPGTPEIRIPFVPSGSTLRRNLYYAKERLREGGPTLVARRGVRKGARLVRARLSH